MACNRHVKSCAKLFARLGRVLREPGFAERHRVSERDFTRKRSLPLPRLIAFLTDLVKGSVQDELDQFFGALMGAPTAVRGVSKAALTLARRKLKASAFSELSQVVLAEFYGRMEVRRFEGMRLLALDGTRLRLPHWEAIAGHFGLIDAGRGRPRAMAQVSLLADVLNGLILDASLSPYENGEKTLAIDQIVSHLGTGDLVVADRNYDAFWLLALIRSTGADFCVRVKAADVKSCRREIKAFLHSGKADVQIRMEPGRWMEEMVGKEGLAAGPLEVRLVRTELPSGELEVLVTSLLDVQRFPVDTLVELYSLRWRIEEKIKMFKARAVIERFTGKTVHSVEQDFHAKILATNLVQILVTFAQRHVDRQGRPDGQQSPKRHRAQINFTQALSKSKNAVAPLLLRLRSPTLLGLLEVFTRSLEPVRPGRRSPRNVSRVKLQTHCANYAPCR